ncbi:MAG: hypothetical protein COW04_06760 [Deltaproteobacteria bacterium CG12_big_fil_rev_8_21_14_0_65_43_10]|nr:MAG: hypothetical protein AUK23_06760 [Deltaproteobacteria bacterium CG2_30_43_15]PIQ45594.1 MAG: hypothetical protein COW04_06760 [Deltaproteobacteria bacterium CG12_big_fil_rev_8_21_14_0_65_43_10]PIZ19624.1 MAG: hypothetical protein COY50_09025 [Deltaproteobacteria bacterium CG_4_10_14_0_8_um_filter_43_12]PJB46019.1 MAG: hypothetical protein CO106_00865 [Deltaproteobacteria bacterium CG_4_9_14_3_um_filter_44_9]HCX89586.1 hypothetical protein [Deltaproteobacteria bacterium]
MENTLAVINKLEQEGLIGPYAIGGAIAATRFIEPIQTYDLDIFVMLPISPSGLASISPIYSYLTQRGYTPQGECIVIEGWPVQFLPVYNQLAEEALAQAIEVKFGETPTRVLSAEYLAAIMLETGRPKDHARLIQFFESDALDLEVLEDIVGRHGLKGNWKAFRKRFLNEVD